MSALARSSNRNTVMRDDQLTPKHRLVAEYMVHGCEHASLCERTHVVDRYDPETGDAITRHPRPGEPLDLLAAAEILHIKRRLARSLSRQPAFQRLLAAETQAFRDGARARATRRMVALIDEPGQGKAADRKVQLQAAAMTLGEIGGGSSTTVNVSVGNTTIAAGVVIERWHDPDDTDDTRTIEHAP